MKNAIYIITVLLLFAIPTTAQKSDVEYFNLTSQEAKGKTGVKESQKLDVQLTTGASVISGNNETNGYQTFVAPKFSYPVSSKLRLQFGMAVSTGRINGFYSPLTETCQANTRYLSNSLFAGGEYDVNERLRISGIILHEMNNCRFDARMQNNRYQSTSFSVGFNYKVTENFHIGVQFQHRDGNNPFYTNPYGSGLRNSGFHGFSQPGYFGYGW